MKIQIFALMFIAAISAGEVDVKLPTEITTLNGKKYSGVQLSKIEPDGIKISHDGGVAKLKAEELPDEIRSRFNFDADAAAAFRSKQSAEQSEALRKIHDERQQLTEKENKLSAQQQKEIQASRVAKQEETSLNLATKIPAPQQGRIYTVEELRSKKADLAGQIVRVRLVANSFSAPEQTQDGGYDVFVGGASNNDYAIIKFPKEAIQMINVFLKKGSGEMTFWGEVSNSGAHWLRAIGRNYSQDKYSW